MTGKYTDEQIEEHILWLLATMDAERRASIATAYDCDPEELDEKLAEWKAKRRQ